MNRTGAAAAPVRAVRRRRGGIEAWRRGGRALAAHRTRQRDEYRR
ncbi:hypothetical protein BURMUCF1_0201 [Burkholderia multivorans ATCC BAA-247]|nr:hypothetical protein BURMUCF1_0201 [Burkholderia multivorans ATCC BAA-247]